MLFATNRLGRSLQSGRGCREEVHVVLTDSIRISWCLNRHEPDHVESRFTPLPFVNGRIWSQGHSHGGWPRLPVGCRGTDSTGDRKRLGRAQHSDPPRLVKGAECSAAIPEPMTAGGGSIADTETDRSFPCFLPKIVLVFSCHLSSGCYSFPVNRSTATDHWPFAYVQCIAVSCFPFAAHESGNGGSHPNETTRFIRIYGCFVGFSASIGCCYQYHPIPSRKC
jgi:hypothetical protein